jgi:hypothetical protein
VNWLQRRFVITMAGIITRLLCMHIGILFTMHLSIHDYVVPSPSPYS